MITKTLNLAQDMLRLCQTKQTAIELSDNDEALMAH